MREQQNGSTRAGAAVADHQVGFLWDGAAKENVGVGESSSFEAGRGGFGDGRGSPVS